MDLPLGGGKAHGMSHGTHSVRHAKSYETLHGKFCGYKNASNGKSQGPPCPSHGRVHSHGIPDVEFHGKIDIS